MRWRHASLETTRSCHFRGARKGAKVEGSLGTWVKPGLYKGARHLGGKFLASAKCQDRVPPCAQQADTEAVSQIDIEPAGQPQYCGNAFV
jgi:hypothetical protein